jgi:hypothetical protein
MSNTRKIRGHGKAHRYEVISVRPHDAATDIIEFCPRRAGGHGDHVVTAGPRGSFTVGEVVDTPEEFRRGTAASAN